MLLVAIIYINAMLERGVFDALRDTLVSKGLSYRSLFWLTGILAFFISPIADNLTTALVMCEVIIPAAIMSFGLPNGSPSTETNAPKFRVKQGGLVIVGLFLATILTAISFHLVLHMLLNG